MLSPRGRRAGPSCTHVQLALDAQPVRHLFREGPGTLGNLASGKGLRPAAQLACLTFHTRLASSASVFLLQLCTSKVDKVVGGGLMVLAGCMLHRHALHEEVGRFIEGRMIAKKGRMVGLFFCTAGQ